MDEMYRFESNLKGGKQSSDKGRENLEYGVSITDGASVFYGSRNILTLS